MFTALLNLTRRSADAALSNSPGLTGLYAKLSSLRNHPWPDVPLDKGRFIIFDTETTGLSCNKGDEIISLGAVEICDGQITGSSFTHLVNPNRAIPPVASEITGISDEMVSDSPDVLTVLDRFLEFAGPTHLVAHNAHFDLSFINSKLRKYCGQRLRNPTLDTYLLSHLLFPYRRSHSLDSLANHFGVPLEGRHTALGDSLITARIFLEMTGSLVSRGIKTTSQLTSYLEFRRLI